MDSNIFIEVNGVKVTVDVEELIEREVKKRLKKIKPKEIVKEVKPYCVSLPGRRQGNTYRLLLEAQLIASSNENSHIIIVTHSSRYGKDLIRQLLEMSFHYLSSINDSKTILFYPNGSTIRFTSAEYLKLNPGYACSFRNPHILYDDSIYLCR